MVCDVVFFHGHDYAIVWLAFPSGKGVLFIENKRFFDLSVDFYFHIFMCEIWKFSWRDER